MPPLDLSGLGMRFSRVLILINLIIKNYLVVLCSSTWRNFALMEVSNASAVLPAVGLLELNLQGADSPLIPICTRVLTFIVSVASLLLSWCHLFLIKQ